MKFWQIVIAATFIADGLFAGSASWMQDGGNWSDPNVWDPHTVPNSSSDIATFSDAVGSFAGGNVDSTFSVASLHFTTALSFVLNNGALNIYNSIVVDAATGGSGCNTTLFLPNDISIVTHAQLVCGSIGGTGGIIKTGTNAVYLGNTCSYSGTTFVNEGIFRSGVADSFSHDSAIVLANAAGVELNNQGNDNTILSLSGGGSLGGNVTFDNGTAGSLTLGDSSNTTFAGVISGLGEIIKRGSGIFTVTGVNTYTEGTTVQDGKFVVNGSITGGITVDSGGVLGGTGTVFGGGAINGILSPGNSIGTITFDTTDGDITLGSSSVTQIELDASSSSKIVNVGGGNIALGGSVSLIQNKDGNYARSGQYTILSGAYTDGFASTVSGALPGFLFNLAYGADLVYLLYEVPPISTSGLSGNNLRLANYLNAYAPTTFVSSIAVLGSELKAGLAAVSPTRNCLSTFAAQNGQMASNQSLIDHMHLKRLERLAKLKTTLAGEGINREGYIAGPIQRPSEPLKKNSYTAWSAPFGEYAKGKGNGQLPDFEAGVGGIVAGFDFNFDEKKSVGVGGAYVYTHLHTSNDAGKANINQGYLTVYSEFVASDWYFDLALWGGYYSSANERHITYSDIDETARATIQGWQLTPHFEVGYDGWLGGVSQSDWLGVEPFLLIDWVADWERSFSEKGAGVYNMGQEGRFCSLFRGETGIRLQQVIQGEWGRLFFTEKGSYAYQKAFNTGHITAFLVGAGGSFTVDTWEQAQNLGVFEFSLLFSPKSRKIPYFDIRYQGEFGSRYQSHQGVLEIGKTF